MGCNKPSIPTTVNCLINNMFYSLQSYSNLLFKYTQKQDNKFFYVFALTVKSFSHKKSFHERSLTVTMAKIWSLC